jgi:glutaminase
VAATSPPSGEQIEERLEALYARCELEPAGRVASYYDSARGYYSPEEAGAESRRFGIALASRDGRMYGIGDDEAPFPLQSLSKIFAYALALADWGRERVLERVGVEPSGDTFHSITFDERNNRPFNPMVNAGAMVTSDLVKGSTPEEKLERILTMLRLFAGNDEIDVDRGTFRDEMRRADGNRAVAYLMRDRKMIGGDVEGILGLYLKQCSVHVTCRDLATMAATLANGCVNPFTGERVLPLPRVRDVLSVLYTCGMYDAAGQWAYDVGVPAKSGVSGGILAAMPGKGGIGVHSPGLDSYGNSARGIMVCREMSENLGLHVFAAEAEDAMLGAAAPSIAP